MFGSSSSSSSTSPPPAPNREERKACWDSRDAYFSCLDRNGVAQAGSEEKKGVCGEERKGYEKRCGQSWIDYFNKRRTLELRQRLTVEAAAQARDSNAANVGR
ncbi:cytochrome c oxidase assembly factor 6, partial [Tremellales sp. Uapishka_1]